VVRLEEGFDDIRGSVRGCFSKCGNPSELTENADVKKKESNSVPKLCPLKKKKQKNGAREPLNLRMAFARHNSSARTETGGARQMARKKEVLNKSSKKKQPTSGAERGGKKPRCRKALKTGEGEEEKSRGSTCELALDWVDVWHLGKRDCEGRSVRQKTGGGGGASLVWPSKLLKEVHVGEIGFGASGALYGEVRQRSSLLETVKRREDKLLSVTRT